MVDKSYGLAHKKNPRRCDDQPRVMGSVATPIKHNSIALATVFLRAEKLRLDVNYGETKSGSQ